MAHPQTTLIPNLESPPLRLLLIITKGDIGGAQMSVYELAAALHRRGVDVTVGYGGQDTFLAQKLEPAGIPTFTFRHLARTYGPISNLRFIFEMKKIIEEQKFSVVHFNSSNALLGAIGATLARPKPKTIFTFRGLSVVDPEFTSSILKRWMYRQMFRVLLLFIDHSVFVSQENHAKAVMYGLAQKSSVIYNGLHPKTLTFYSAEEAQEKLSQTIHSSLADRFVIGSIGRLAYQKNYEFLIRMMPRVISVIPNALCIIIGDGPKREEYHALIKKLHLEKHCFLIGSIAEARQYLKAFDVFVLPSRYEGLSVTLLETLFAGTPVLASDVGGNTEVLGEAGRMYPLDDESLFLKEMEKLASDTGLRKQLENEAHKRSPLFSIEKTASAYWELYVEHR